MVPLKVIRGARWGTPARGSMTRSELREMYIRDSEIFVLHESGNGPKPDPLVIELHGELAAVPAMKNSNRMRGSGGFGLDKRTLAKLEALDILWDREMQDRAIPISYGTEHMHCVLINGERDYSFDSDGCATTIKDWLEPREKHSGKRGEGKSKGRGWGIGVVDNDAHVTCYPLYSWQTGLGRNHTTLIIRPWEAVRKESLALVSAHYLGEYQ